jgi:hypothetical protein
MIVELLGVNYHIYHNPAKDETRVAWSYSSKYSVVVKFFAPEKHVTSIKYWQGTSLATVASFWNTRPASMEEFEALGFIRRAIVAVEELELEVSKQ